MKLLKTKFTLLLAMVLLPMITFAQENTEEMGIDQKIDQVFGDMTGWFVQIIFYQIPFSENINIYWVMLQAQESNGICRVNA